MVIVLAVNMHACVTYSHVGSWYVNEPPDYPLAFKLVFLFWQGHLQSFFMGVLFLVAGYFAYGSLARKGPAGFARERLLRLGAPTLLYMLVLHPLIVFAINPNGDHYGSRGAAYGQYLYRGRFLGGSGPMWFAAALLVFSVALAGLASLLPSAMTRKDTAPRAPGAGAIVIWGLAAVAFTFIVRTAEPLGTSVLNMQLGYFPQYVLAFGTGFAAAKGRWLVPLARSSAARRAGWMGLLFGPVALAVVLFRGGILNGEGLAPFSGGWNLRSLGLAAWDQLAGLGLGLGALAFCSGKLNKSTRLSRWLNARSFGVYLFHPVVLILVTLAMRPLDINLFFKVSILTGAGLAGSYLVSDLGGRIPGLRSLL
jgi:fucose 4-O-acetylase-like acetyltransferase